MYMHGKLTAVLCVLALALGLAACGGGSGSGIATVSIDTAGDQRKAISGAIQTARNAVGALGDDATEAQLATDRRRDRGGEKSGVGMRTLWPAANGGRI